MMTIIVEACCCCVSLRRGVIGIIIFTLLVVAYVVGDCFYFITQEEYIKEIFVENDHDPIQSYESYKVVYCLNLTMAIITGVLSLLLVATVWSNNNVQCVRYRRFCVTWVAWKVTELLKSFVICIYMVARHDIALARPFVITFLITVPIYLWSVIVVLSYYQVLGSIYEQESGRRVRLSGEHITIQVSKASSGGSLDQEKKQKESQNGMIRDTSDNQNGASLDATEEVIATTQNSVIPSYPACSDTNTIYTFL